MRKADLLVAAAGTTCWEACFMQLPSLLFGRAENQLPLVKSLGEKGAANALSKQKIEMLPPDFERELLRLSEDFSGRKKMAGIAGDEVDGGGSARLAAILGGHPFSIRGARNKDSGLFFTLANDPDVRRNSFSPEPIPWESHVAWFESMMSASSTALWVAEAPDGTPVGVLRVESLDARSCEVSIAIASEFRGKGLASSLLNKAIDAFSRKTTGIHSFLARIKTSNQPSLRAFERAGFRKTTVAIQQGAEFYWMEKIHE